MKKNRADKFLSVLIVILMFCGCAEQKADTLAVPVSRQGTTAVTTEETVSEESEWTQEEIKSTFFENYSMSQGTEVMDCKVVSDVASELAGVILLEETDAGETYTGEIRFTQKDNEIKYVRIDSR